MTCDLLEADGYDVYYTGGGVANDEIVNEIGEMNTDILVIFGAVANTVPPTRLLIDRLSRHRGVPATADRRGRGCVQSGGWIG